MTNEQSKKFLTLIPNKAEEVKLLQLIEKETIPISCWICGKREGELLYGFLSRQKKEKINLIDLKEEPQEFKMGMSHCTLESKKYGGIRVPVCMTCKSLIPEMVNKGEIGKGIAETLQEEIKDRKKIVLMALAESGRNTLCKKFLNERWVPRKDEPYYATIDYERHKRIIHGTEFTIFNLGGQTAFLDRYIGEIAEFIFGKIDTLVFIVNSIAIKNISRAKYYFDQALERIRIYNPEASVFLLLNKIDLLPRDMKEEVCQTLKENLLTGVNREVLVYETSIFSSSSTRAIEDVYRRNIRIFDADLSVEMDEIDQDKEEDDMLSLSLQEALKILRDE